MQKVSRSEQFKHSYARMLGSGDLDTETFEEFLILLSEHARLPPEWHEHPLTREWQGYWDAHLARDVVVIYKRVGNEVRLVDIGRHEHVFLNYRRWAVPPGGEWERPDGSGSNLFDRRVIKKKRAGRFGANGRVRAKMVK